MADQSATQRTPRWRWVTDDGRVMTEWSSNPPPPEFLRYIADEKGGMHVEFAKAGTA